MSNGGPKIGHFVYPWGNGHYFRSMRLYEEVRKRIGGAESHFVSGPPIYERLRARFEGSEVRVSRADSPTPIDGRAGPSVSRSLYNVLLPASGRPALVRQIASFLRQERAIYDRERFELAINDGDMGSNVLARNRGIPSMFITNQFRPRLWMTRAYMYPGLYYIASQIAKADRILVADSAPPWTMCEYNLNFPRSVQDKVSYVGHFARSQAPPSGPKSDLERLAEGADYGYWMRTGNESTNAETGRMYEEAFRTDSMHAERRIVSHARADPSIDGVTGRDGKRYGISEALEKKVDWLQIDAGFLSEQQMGAVLGGCKYAVINGSHTVMGEVIGGMKKPVIGMPIYDEHTNQIRWAEERSLGLMARSARAAARAASAIREDYGRFEQGIAEYSAHHDGGGASRAAGVASEMLESKK